MAIACQGGGSHTAFTAGVLDRLLAEEEVGFEVAELSGTSGGAICAFATWFALARAGDEGERSEPRDGREEARRLLAEVWDDIAVDGPMDDLANTLGVGIARAQSMGVPLPAVSPYDLPADLGRETLRSVLEAAVPPDELAEVVGSGDEDVPRLDVGAVDVQRGTFRTFTERDVTHDAVLASAAVPSLFRAAPVSQSDGTTRWYWDGLFSQNPPLGDLFGRSPDRAERADELWIVQINPQREEEIPRALEAINDRRNELGGNLSVNQELRTIRLLNQWRAEGRLDDVYRPLEVKTIELDESLASPGRAFDYATKLDRSRQFLDRLWDHGREQAERFLATERDRRHVRDTVSATWSGAREVEIDDRTVPTFRAHLPTSFVELRNYLQDEPEQERDVLGAAEYAEFVESLRAAVSDLSFDVEETVAEPGKVATRWRATGAYTGQLLDIEPTGGDVTLSGMRIDHLEDGRLAESWSVFEQWSLLRQVDAAETLAPLSTASRVTATPVVTQLSAPAENEEVARIEVEDVWNRGQRDRLDRVLADDCVLHLDGTDDLAGRDAYWAFVERYREAFPDLELTIEDTVSEGDKIVLRTRLRGTHEGSFLGIDPTGEAVDVSRMVVHHLDDGRVVETGMVEDTVRLLHQLGVPPSRMLP